MMLHVLHIENIALIESADISFSSGFNVLTGETGAGKSIVVDSIGAALGGRTSRDLIRTGAKRSLVRAVFCGVSGQTWPDFMPPCESNDEIQLQREMQTDGRNLCRVNGKSVTVAQLRQIGRLLLNIHGQQDGQQLLDPACHLQYLDNFGHTRDLLAAYQVAYRALSALNRKIASLTMDAAERARRVDSLHYQIRELEQANLIAGEEEQLHDRRDLLRGAGKLMESIQSGLFALDGDEQSLGAIALIGDAVRSAHHAARYSARFTTLEESAGELLDTARNVLEQFRDIESELNFSPEELDALESRLDTLYRLKQKYGATVEDMIDYLNQCRTELDQIEFADDTIAGLKKRGDVLRREAQEKAMALSEARRAAAELLQSRVQSELYQLDMAKVRFQVEFSPKGNAGGIDGADMGIGMDETGADEVQFLMSANVGEKLKPIQKVASGGELARIMLALKNVLAEDDGVGSMVFDEVDAGVSGRAAQKVAEKMARVAQQKQVLCVTHLPQIAAMANTHFCVEKGERDGRTYTHVTRLDRKARREELARLIGGAAVTQPMLQSAEELLVQAEQYRNPDNMQE